MGTAAVVLVLAVLGFILAVPAVNDSLAQATAAEVKAAGLPENTTFIESFSGANKYVGNGNGIQYLGGMLIKSSLTADELRAFYPDFFVDVQAGKSLGFIEHGKLELESDVKGNGYYIVYKWDERDTIFADLDLRGH